MTKEQNFTFYLLASTPKSPMRPTATVLVSAAQGYFPKSRSLVHNLRDISSLLLTLPWLPLLFTRDHDWWLDGCVDFRFRVSFRLVDTSRLTQSETLSTCPVT